MDYRIDSRPLSLESSPKSWNSTPASGRTRRSLDKRRISFMAAPTSAIGGPGAKKVYLTIFVFDLIYIYI